MRNHKKTVALLLLAAVACFSLSGCSAMQQPEYQAYALAMCIDRRAEGPLDVGVLFSKVGANDTGTESGSGEDSDETSSYFARAESFPEALDLLQATTPRTLNLSQLKSVIISEQLAREPGFKDLIEQLMLTNHVYGAPYVTICQGEASDFIEQVKPKLGGGLSSELNTSLEQYAAHGYIRLVTLSDLYYALNSIYGDPVAIFGAVDSPDADDPTLPPGQLGDALPGTLPTTGSIKTQFMGTVLMKDGAMIGVLDGAQTRWMNILSGNLTGFNYICQGLPLRISIKGRPKISVDVGTDPPSIRIALNVVPNPKRQMPDPAALQRQICAELGDLFAHCQSLGVDPFGFAEYAAARFATIDDFVAYDWHRRFQGVQITLDLSVVGAY